MTGATRARWTGRGARGFLDKRKGLVNFKEKVIFLQTVKKMCFMPKKGCVCTEIMYSMVAVYTPEGLAINIWGGWGTD